MDINIVTEEQLKEVDEYIKESNFWKSGTGETVKSVFIALVSYGMESDIAINNISAIANAMSDEYGD
jgi:hypothetical protein